MRDAVDEGAAARERKILARAESISSGPYAPPAGAARAKIAYTPAGIPLDDEAWAIQSAIDGGKLLKLHGAMAPGGAPDEAVVRAYLELASAGGAGAAFMAELLPTDTGHLLRAPATEGLRGTAWTAMARLGNMRVARAYLRANPGRSMYALLVPYSNTVRNVLESRAAPLDGVRSLERYVAGVAGSKVAVIVVGYSQGAAVALEYEAAHPSNDQGVSYVVALAPMGGADRRGESGVWSGVRDGARTLAVANASDPAIRLYHSSAGRVFLRAVAFAVSPGRRLHSELADGDAKDGPIGYEAAALGPRLDEFFENAAAAAYGKESEWGRAEAPGVVRRVLRALGGAASEAAEVGP